MNIKAERIEQMIQLVNRNLLLVFSGQRDGISPLEARKLQKVDTVIFGHDKFAYEMVHFINSSSDKIPSDNSLFALWESNFVHGLENLLVECAVIQDDIERDCFVSRVYCWFTEKLSERRDVPRAKNIGLDQLKSQVGRIVGNASHSVRGLDQYDPNDTVDHRSKLMIDEEHMNQTAFQAMEESDNQFASLPPIQAPSQKHKFGTRKVPIYVKHSYPTVFTNKNASENPFLPKLPGADENYGMIYSKPETDAERNMNELWLARRKQEAFDYKTQQQLAIVMDRLALHKSRMESDSLRRQESELMLRQSHRPRSANDVSPVRPSSERNSASYRSIANRLRQTLEENDSPSSSPERGGGRQRNNKNNTGGVQFEGEGRKTRVIGVGEGTNVVVSGHGADKEQSIAAAGRISVPKSTGKGGFLPMRFKTEAPDNYLNKYMQLSDSDDDDKPDKPTRAGNKSTNKPGKKGSGNAKQDILFKRDHPAMRERPLSAKLFRTVASADPEFKVFYRHCNFRRMPLTAEQEIWLDERETERTKKSEETAKQLFADAQAKADKKGAKDDKGKKDGKDKKKDGKDKTGTVTDDKPKPKYKSATQFMATHFPKFEDDEQVETMGPMRQTQLIEVSDVMDVFTRKNMAIKEAVLKKALMIPQDKPESICLENLREEKEGLMANPNPPEFWRKMVVKKGGKKGGGKKKKKG